MKVRKISMTVQILVVNILVLLIATFVLGFVSTRQSEGIMKELIRQRMLDISNTAAACVDGDILENLTADDVGNDDYNIILKELSRYRDNTDLEYIYCMRQTGPESFIFTVDADPEEPAEFGDEVETTEALVNAGNGVADADREAYEDEWGLHYSSYSPVYNSAHKIVGIVGVDFSANWYEKKISDHIRSVMFLSLAILILSGVIVLLIVRKISKGFITLNEKLCDVADGSGDLTKNVEIFPAMNLRPLPLI